MLSHDSESEAWIRRAQHGQNPFSYTKFNGLQVISFVWNCKFDIQEHIGQSGHACWRAINPSTVRPRLLQMEAKLRAKKAVWSPGPNVSGDSFIINETIPRSERNRRFYFNRDWSWQFNAHHPGIESIVTTCSGCNSQLESTFVIHFSGTGFGSSPTEGGNASPGMGGNQAGGHDKPHVFISHSSLDKGFVRQLTTDLEAQNLNIWLDEQVLRVGDSIVDGISQGLKEADYLIVVVSAASAQSNWVQAELNAALMQQLSDKGIVVLPVRIDDTELPPLLRDRVYADFRRDYQAGLERLLQVLRQESSTTAALTPSVSHPTVSNPASKLLNLKVADLRRLMTRRLNRNEVGTLWFSIIESSMDNDMPQRDLQSCVVELLVRAQQRNRLAALIDDLLEERPDIADDL